MILSPQGNIRQYLETFLVITAGGMMLSTSAPTAEDHLAPNVSSAEWGDASLELPGKPTHLVGPIWSSLCPS